MTLRDSGFYCKVDENRVFLGYYAASSGNSLPMFWDNLSVPSSRVRKGEGKKGTNELSRNVGKELSLLAA